MAQALADSNGKEHNVVIVYCSAECRNLPLDVGLWVHFVPSFCGVVLGSMTMMLFFPCTAFPKQSCFCWLFLLFLSAGQCR